MNLADYNTLKKFLEKEGFNTKKSLGQNFLVDGSVCPAMAAAACDGDTGALEIGPGAGVLTRELSDAAKRVVAIELDERLKPVLAKSLADKDNVEVIFGDAMKLDLNGLIAERFADCKRVCVCANLPYYITSPIIMGLLESRLPIDNITVMVQKEAGTRLCAEMGTRDVGAVTAAVRYYSEPKLLFNVSRGSFIPSPNVDSCVIKLDIHNDGRYKAQDEEFFFRTVRGAFSQRRKNLLNSLSSSMGMEKALITKAVENAGIPANARPEQLSMEEFLRLAEELNLMRNSEFGIRN